MDKRSKFDRLRLSFQSPVMFKRLYVVERKFPLPDKATFTDVCGFIVLGVRSKLIFSTVLFSTTEIARSKEIFCTTESGVNLSLGIVLLTLTLPGLVLKIFSDGIPPFLTARMLGSVFLTTVGTFLIAFGKTAAGVLLGIGVHSYSYGLREITYSQLTAYFPPGVFKAWAFGCVISNFLGGISMLIFTMLLEDVRIIMVLYLLAPLMEVVAYCVFIRLPVGMRVAVIERPEDDVGDNHKLELWQPGGTTHQYQYMKVFWPYVLCHCLVVWFSMFNLQGTFETLVLQGFPNHLAYQYLYSIYCSGSLFGALFGLLLNTRHLWICVILEICTTTIFLMQSFCLFRSYNSITFSLVFAEGSLVHFSYVSCLIFLISKVPHKHSRVVAYNILSLLESISSIPAAGSAFILHKLYCELWSC